MNHTLRLFLIELTLLRRDVGVVIFGLSFPAVLLLVLGLLPGFTDPDPDLGGASLIELYTPIVLVLTFAMVGISSLSAYITTYRQQGVLRRLRVTPVRPRSLLIAQFAAHLLVALLGCALAVAVALTVFDVGAPDAWGSVLLGLTLAAACLFALGTLLGALVPNTNVAGAVGTLVWMPIMVLAGLWFPREAMPELMRRISDLSPGGAAVDAVTQAWFSGVTATSSLVVLAVSAAALIGIATLTFRWE